MSHFTLIPLDNYKTRSPPTRVVSGFSLSSHLRVLFFFAYSCSFLCHSSQPSKVTFHTHAGQAPYVWDESRILTWKSSKTVGQHSRFGSNTSFSSGKIPKRRVTATGLGWISVFKMKTFQNSRLALSVWVEHKLFKGNSSNTALAWVWKVTMRDESRLCRRWAQLCISGNGQSPIWYTLCAASVTGAIPLRLGANQEQYN